MGRYTGGKESGRRNHCNNKNTLNSPEKDIFISGFSATDRAKAAQKLGAGVYVIKKPYFKGKIGVAIRDELGKNIDDDIFNSMG